MQRKKQYRKKQWRLAVMLTAALCFLCLFSLISLAAEPNYVYFDLSAGSVTINGSTGQYTGYRYDGNASTVTVTGNIADAEAFYVYQSNGDINTGLIDGAWVLPTHTAVLHNGMSWGDYVTNNSDVEAVIAAWNTSAPLASRQSTPNRIVVTGQVNVMVVIDNIWSSFHQYGASVTTGAIDFQPGSSNSTPSSVTIQTVGDNRVGNIYYATYSQTVHRLIIEEKTAGSTLTVANLESNTNTNYWRAAIGASDGADHSRGIVINSGTVFAGTNEKDDCTAIGGGGNGYGTVTINGGRITATVASSGAAIGGGIGKTSTGGAANVTINGGEVYAYNFSCKSGYSQQGVKYIPAAAIGGGSSARKTCNPSTITITGGYVFAQSVGGTAIGGGSSADSNGGDATITITGGEIYAKSIAGVIDGVDVPVGVAIGGGTGGKLGNGGNVTLKVSGNAILRTGSIGGGATIATSDGYHIGNATVTVDGGDISGQIIMAEGALQNCSFTMTGGVIHNDVKDPTYIFKNQDGGAIYMDDSRGVAKVSGGVIRDCSARHGGALYMTAGSFEISGTGSVTKCTANENGGAVYLGGGTMTVSGGTISHCTATNNGGAAYLGGGTLTVTDGTVTNNFAINGGGAYLANGTMTVEGGSIISNTASSLGGGAYLGGGTFTVTDGTITANRAISGGGAYVSGGDAIVKGGSILANIANENGGGLAVNNGNFTMYGGAINSNRAESGSGGGIFVSTSGEDVTVHIRSGSVSHNYSGTSGGALSVIGSSGGALYGLGGSEAITVTVGVKDRHTVDTENGTVACDHDGNTVPEINACPVIEGNKSEDEGGGVYVSGSDNTVLNFYCLIANENTVNQKNSDSNFMKVDGGTVVISTLKTEAPSPTSDLLGYGYINVGENDSFHVSGGKVDIYGVMSNPQIMSPILADIANLEIHHCEDHRDVDDSYYSVRYFENFLQTGKFELISIPVDSWYAISGSVFYNAGYEIDGWTTDIRGYGYGDTYIVGKEYHFTGENPPEEPGNLILYAVWNPIGYKIHFDANTGGNDYYGTMASILDKKYGDPPFTLPANTFVYPGFRFNGWDDKNGKSYTDKQSVENLTTSAEITLYAIWIPCEHELEHVSVTLEASRIAMSCVCGGYSEALTLTASGGVYNGDPYYALCTHSYAASEITVNGEKKKYEPKHWASLPEIVYAKDGVALASGVYPVNASDAYSASITQGGKMLTVYFTIEKAEQLPPMKPTYQLNPDGTMNHILVDDPMDTSGKTIEYQMAWYAGSTPNETLWGTTREFSLPITFTNYYVYARYEETENYKASPAIRADGLYYIGEVLVQIECEYGIDYIREEVTGGLRITISPYTTHYLYHTKVNVTGGASVEEELSRTEYLIHSLPTEGTVVISISGVHQKPTVDVKLDPNQVFDDVKGIAATISRDSAFTAYFHIQFYENYTDPALTFTKALPIGTTVILMDKATGAYWFTTLAAAKTKISLNEFRKMGDIKTALSSHGTVLQYQAIVDFSRVTEDFAIDEMDVSFTATPSDALAADPWIPAFPSQTRSLTLTAPAEFDVAVSPNNTALSDTKFIDVVYAEVSDQDPTEWLGRKGALVLRYYGTSVLPADAYLEVFEANATRRIYPDDNGAFIIPLSGIGRFTVECRLVSQMMPNAGGTYTFTVELYASNSTVAVSPMNGEHVATAENELVFAVEEKFERALDLVLRKTVYELNEMLVASVTVQMKENDVIKARLLYYNEESGVYVNTALPIDTTGNIWNITLAGQIEGRYCLEVTINDSTGEAHLKVPYYFVIHQSADTAKPNQ